MWDANHAFNYRHVGPPGNCQNVAELLLGHSPIRGLLSMEFLHGRPLSPEELDMIRQQLEEMDDVMAGACIQAAPPLSPSRRTPMASTLRMTSPRLSLEQHRVPVDAPETSPSNGSRASASSAELRGRILSTWICDSAAIGLRQSAMG